MLKNIQKINKSEQRNKFLNFLHINVKNNVKDKSSLKQNFDLMLVLINLLNSLLAKISNLKKEGGVKTLKT